MNVSTTVGTPLGTIELSGSADAGIQLGKGDLPVKLQNGMVVDKAIAAILSIGIVRSCSDIHFCCRLRNDTIRGYPETGESLECITWETGEWALSIGTEDSESLAQRLPDLMKKEDVYTVTYSPSGIEMRLSQVNPKAPVSFHFIIAFKKRPDSRECSTWFAADMPHEAAKKHVHIR